jgi:uncharacterized delta-60 repeat protein
MLERRLLRRMLQLTTVCLAAAAVLPQSAGAGVGDIDVRFGSSGHLEPPDQAGPVVVVLPDGRLLVIGDRSPIEPADEAPLALYRYTGWGKADTTFGPDGFRTVLLPLPWVHVNAGAVRTDGRIMVAGVASAPDTRSVRFLGRLTPEGVLDPSFGAGGYVTHPNGGYSGYSAVLALSNGDTVGIASEEGSHWLDRFDSDGTLIRSIALDGEPLRAVAQADGRIVLVGRRGIEPVAWRLGTDDRLDKGFGSDGYAPLREFYPGAVAIEPHTQRILVCGETALERLQPDGGRDDSFGDGGHVPFSSLVTHMTRCTGIVVDDDGGILFSGSDIQGTQAVLHGSYLYRLRADGRVDPAFAAGGYAVARGRSLPGMYWTPTALLPTRDRAVLIVWSMHELSGTSSRWRTIVDRIELGADGPRAAGLAHTALRLVESGPSGSETYEVLRNGPADGVASVRYEPVPGTATAADFVVEAGVLSWADGDATAKPITLHAPADNSQEGEETFRLRFFDAQGVDLETPEVLVTVVDRDAIDAVYFAEHPIEVPASQFEDLTLRVARGDSGAGPVTVFYLLHNGFDSCCLGRIDWPAGDVSERDIAVGQLWTMGGGVGVYLLVDWFSAELPASAAVTIVDDTDPEPEEPPPPGGASGSASGGGGSLGASALFILALCIAAAAWRSARRRHGGGTER